MRGFCTCKFNLHPCLCWVKDWSIYFHPSRIYCFYCRAREEVKCCTFIVWRAKYVMVLKSSGYIQGEKQQTIALTLNVVVWCSVELGICTHESVWLVWETEKCVFYLRYECLNDHLRFKGRLFNSQKRACIVCFCFFFPTICSQGEKRGLKTMSNIMHFNQCCKGLWLYEELILL